MATTPILPADHKVRYLYGSRTITKLASDLRPGKAMRFKCLDCSGGSTAEVAACPVDDCPLWPFRMGRRPRYGRSIDSGAAEGRLRGTLAAPQELDL